MKIKNLPNSVLALLCLMGWQAGAQITDGEIQRAIQQHNARVQHYGFHNHMSHWPSNYGFGDQRLSSNAKLEALDSARANINLLKENTLIVRLKTGSRKTNALKELLKNPNLKEKFRRRYERMLEETASRTSTENEHLKNAFLAHYSFSKLLFMPDTSATALKSGVRKGIFLNEKLELDPSLSLEGSYFIAYHESSDSRSNRHTAQEGLRIVDQNFQPLKYPFPSNIHRKSLAWLFSMGLDGYSTKDHKRHYDYLVKRLNMHMEIK